MGSFYELTLGDLAGSSCTLVNGVGFMCLIYVFYFIFHCHNLLTVVLNIPSNLLSWSIPLSFISVIKFTFSAAVSCCAACTTVSSGVALLDFLCIYVWSRMCQTYFCPWLSAPYIVAAIVIRECSLVSPTDLVGCPLCSTAIFLWTWTEYPNGAIGKQLKPCGTFKYAYADTFCVLFAFHSTFACISICGMILAQRYSGK